MDGFKNIFASKSIWGGLIAILGVVAPMLGFSFSTEDGQTVMGLVEQVTVIVGTVLALYGRVTATKKIGSA